MGEQRLRAKKIVQVTLELVREFRQNHGWADISHRGFRPMKALGFDKLEGVLQTLVDLSPPWVRSAYGLQEVFARSGFPFLRCQGLVAKVVADRWDELTQGFVFRSLDSQWVTVPRTGCAREYLSMLQGSTAAFGVGFLAGCRVTRGLRIFELRPKIADKAWAAGCKTRFPGCRRDSAWL